MPPIPFEIPYDEKDVEELHRRLDNTALPPFLPSDTDDKWQGIHPTLLTTVLTAWRQLDWKTILTEKLNTLPHFTTTLDTYPNSPTLHFLWRKSTRPHARPLLLLHGWPGSFWEFAKVMDALANPDDASQPAFHVVVPSLPGFGYSPLPESGGIGLFEMARMMNALMLSLGYEHYYAQGGDLGAFISRCIAVQFPDHCDGFHVNLAIMYPPMDFSLFLSHPLTIAKILVGFAVGFQHIYTKEESMMLARSMAYQNHGSGYFHMQSTKPRTLAVALHDSPAGLCAWLLDLMRRWTDLGLDSDQRVLPTSIPLEDFLINLMIYHTTKTIGSSCRVYYEFRKRKEIPTVYRQKVAVPCGVAIFAHDIGGSPREWFELTTNVASWRFYEKGGHFAAMEVPTVFLHELRTYFRDLESKISSKL